MKNWYRGAISVLALSVLAWSVQAEDPPKMLEPPKGSVLVELKTTENVAAGFVGPGSRLDVVFKTTEPKTTVILEDLLVYAVETSLNDNDKRHTYTICMTKAQSLVIAPLLQAKVKPQMTLRAPDKK